MKKMSFLLVAALLVGCGGGDGSSPHPPAISNLRYSPTSAIENEGGGFVSVTGYCDFTDSGGDLDWAFITIYDSNGNERESTGTPIPHTGETVGVLAGSVTINTLVVGTYTFTLVVYDSAGYASNSLAGTFSVAPDPWQPRSNPLSPGTRITSVAYGGGIFLAGANDNSVLGSFDGSSWFIANLGIGKTIQRIAYGNGHFVAIAEDPDRDVIITSTDNGTTWSTASQTFSKQSCRDVSYGNGNFFVTQENSDYLYASTDNGATWSLVSSGLVGRGMDAPAYGTGKFVAAVDYGYTLYSGDGISWSLGSHHGSYFRPYIAFDNGVFAIVPSFGDVHVSHDGATTWQNKFTIPTYWTMSDLAAGDGIYVGVGKTDTLQQKQGVLCASSGGDSWVSRTLGNRYLWGIAYGKGTFVAVGDNAAIYQSAPGWRP